MKKEEESTKMGIVCDAATKSLISNPSLTEYLEIGPPLQNFLWLVLIQNRISPIAPCGDIKETPLQVHIKEQDPDPICLHWLINKDPNQIEIYDLPKHCLGSYICHSSWKQHLLSIWQVAKNDIQQTLTKY